MRLIVHKFASGFKNGPEIYTRPRHSYFIKDSAATSKDLRKPRYEASQDLLFACISFVVLLAVAVADVAFRAS